MKTQAQEMTPKLYPDYAGLNLPEVDKAILKFWKENGIFEKSVSSREGSPSFVFYEGPPSANGLPGIHHVMARTIKDLFCRYQTLQGKQVHRKAGWDTHGLPVELNVEKKLGIRKEDIGKTISVEEYNQRCRESVLEFQDQWNKLTEEMGYWVDLSDPYITFDNKYIESVWWLLRQLFDKGYLYKGLTIQPYSPAAGTGLSSHELSYTGTYQDVKDTTIVAQFKAVRNAASEKLFEGAQGDVYFLAWTTTPWTLPANSALAVGAGIEYVQVNATNVYTQEPVSVILARELLVKNFSPEGEFVQETDDATGRLLSMRGTGKISGQVFSFEMVRSFTGRELVGMAYEQLLPYVQPKGKAFEVITGDFVTTEDGTGIVHIAPTFGADDMRVANQNGIAWVMVTDEDGTEIPLVDKSGKFVQEMGEFAGRYVKDYKNEGDAYQSPDVDIAIKLKTENRAFRVEKYEHSYPHCWRTGKPVLYYPLDSWFVRTTAVRDRLVELNKTINWKPKSTGEGRFGNWLENIVDWNLSRSRFWGVPLPIWATEDYKETKCIGSIEELRAEAEKAVAAGLMSREDADSLTDDSIDLHRPYVDRVVLLASDGRPMRRETDLIDVWFDSGAMPYAQFHYPFENKEKFQASFPADFISEGVDQTRGWFFTLHAIATLVFDSVAYKNVLSTGLVLDKYGQKMSKSKGNVVYPHQVLPVYGVDATRWYMVGASSPWENLKFDEGKIDEVRRRFFGTLYNTYSFFALYANLDQFAYSAEERIPMAQRTELDRWITSLKNSMLGKVAEAFDQYEPTQVVRVIDNFVDNLSNWYVRLSRRIFWKGEMDARKMGAYQTLFECLVAVAQAMSPIAPFFSDQLYRDLTGHTQGAYPESVHLSYYPEVAVSEVDTDLEERMEKARVICSLVHSVRKRPDVQVNARTPLQRVLVPVANDHEVAQLKLVQDLILQEVNVKELGFIHESDTEQPIVRTAKANFKVLGKRLGKLMKATGTAIQAWGQEEIRTLESQGTFTLEVEGETVELTPEDVEITSQDVPGWKVGVDGAVTVAVDVTVTDALRREGIAREVVNRIQNVRKDNGLDVTDRIAVQISENEIWKDAVIEFLDYIRTETLADVLQLVSDLDKGTAVEIEGQTAYILIQK
jgi:isoleucyl-tRNA synthetase